MLLTRNQTYPIGLDISNLSIKLAQLNRGKDKIKIQALSKSSLPKGIIENGEIKNQAELIKAIKKSIDVPLYGKTSSEEVVACLPESKTFIKLIGVLKSPNSLADIMAGEIEKHVPLTANELFYDWQVIEELPDKYLILIGAAPKNIVSQYASMLDAANLTLIALEIEPVAIARCLLKEEAPKSKSLIFGAKSNTEPGLNYGILDIGADHTCLTVYSKNTILFTVSLPISGEEITSKIKQALNLTKDQAEKAKIICGLDETKANGVIKEILGDTIKKMTSKIKDAFRYYQNYFGQRGPINQILLCGGGANIINLARNISEELSVEVKLANALTHINETKDKFANYFMEKHTLNMNLMVKFDKKSEDNISLKQNSASTYSTAIGLALRRIFIDKIYFI